MMKVNQLLKPNVVNTTAFNSLPPNHRDVVNDFYKVVELEKGNVVDRVEAAIDVVADKHNVSTEIVYNYIDKETGE